MQKENIHQEHIVNKFKSVLDNHNEVLDHIRKLSFKHDSLQKIRMDFVREFEGLIEGINIDYQTVRDEIVWDHLVIGFFGETNAGKSAIIETLRLRYGIDRNDNTVNGKIVGNGESDYTKEANEYEINLEGRKITLIDIPGIEGDESKYKDIIVKALRRVHYIFYVHKNAKCPDTKITERIKDYLSDWTRVCSIYNVSNAIGNYDEEEDRELLMTPDVMRQAEEIKVTFKSILGNLYEDNITLQGQIALCSSGEFPSIKKLSTDVDKLKRFFKNAEKAYKFSCFQNLCNLLITLNQSYTNVIFSSQNQKLRALKLNSQNRINSLEETHQYLLNQMEARLLSMKSDIKAAITSTKTSLKRKIDKIVDNQKVRVKKTVGTVLDSHKNNHKQLKPALYQILNEELNYQIYRELKKELESIIDGLKLNIETRIKELPGIRIMVPRITITINFTHSVDVNIIVKKLDRTMGDALDVIGGITGGAAAGTFFGPWGTLIGGGIGGLLGLGKMIIYNDGGIGKAKNELSEELNVWKEDINEELTIEIRKIKEQFTSYQSRLIEIIDKEVDNLRKMRNEYEEILRLI